MQRSFSSVLAILVLGIASGNGVQADDAKVTKPTAKSDAKTSVGTLTIGSKTYKLPHVVAYPVKALDEDGFAVLFSEKEIPVEKLKAALIKGQGTDDSFFLFEPQVKVNFNKAGEPSFSNSWADNTSISVSGSLKGELAVKEGRAVGFATMATGDKPENKKSFDIRFDVPLLAVNIPKAEPKPESKPDDTDKPKSKSRKSKKKDKASDVTKPAADGALSVYDLPMPEDATDVERKKLVEHLNYKSPSSVSKVTDFLVQKLEADGWESDGSDLKNAKTAILKREKGEAKLTIFVKTDGTGTKVNMMTEGLNWDEKKKADEATKK